MTYFASNYILLGETNSMRESINHLVIMLLVEEFGFYYTHRLFHTYFFYKYHKIHHEFYNPIGIAALYCHLSEFLLTNLLPLGMAPIVSSHLISPIDVNLLYFWIFCATLNTVLEHSNLAKNPIRRHYYHHVNGKKNYGVLGILDWMHGTLGLEAFAE